VTRHVQDERKTRRKPLVLSLSKDEVADGRTASMDFSPTHRAWKDHPDRSMLMVALESSLRPVSAALLAAGSASRMGREKLVLALDGQPLLRRVAREIIALGPSEVIVVVNETNHAAILDALGDSSARVLVNRRASEGIGTSIGLAAASVSPSSKALVVLQGDQPFVDRAMLRRLIREWQEGSPEFVASSYDGLVTTPVLFTRALLPELVGLRGDRGAKAVLERHAGRGRVVEFPAWRGSDVDTPADYAKIRRLSGDVVTLGDFSGGRKNDCSKGHKK
jgi:molybdenum cofactor cytidylyltransferase